MKNSIVTDDRGGYIVIVPRQSPSYNEAQYRAEIDEIKDWLAEQYDPLNGVSWRLSPSTGHVMPGRFEGLYWKVEFSHYPAAFAFLLRYG